eukprot:1137584-Pelagomonas_calceolata.AAC.2
MHHKAALAALHLRTTQRGSLNRLTQALHASHRSIASSSMNRQSPCVIMEQHKQGWVKWAEHFPEGALQRAKRAPQKAPKIS